MSPRVVDLSADLQQLHQDRYDIEVTPGGLLVVGNVPYVTPSQAVARGRLVSSMELAGGMRTVNPVSDHSIYFAGEMPCDHRGQPLTRVVIESSARELEQGLMVNHRFSCKPADGTSYPDYHAKISSYVDILMTHARVVDPNVSALRPHPVVLRDDDPEAPFEYPDTAAARSGIGAIADRLRGQRIAIVGLGGTGSYILDFVAKTPVREIHLFDGDDFLDHNAFRAPGAADSDELNAQPKKVDYLQQRYSKMKRGIIPHAYNIDSTTVAELSGMNFVFLAAEGGDVKRLLVTQLDGAGIDYVDVGLSVYRAGDTLGGMVCTTTSSDNHRSHVDRRIDFSRPSDDDLYADNIQIAELNALNAVVAVVKWKKLNGFYADYEHEYFSTYIVDKNRIINSDRA